MEPISSIALALSKLFGCTQTGDEATCKASFAQALIDLNWVGPSAHRWADVALLGVGAEYVIASGHAVPEPGEVASLCEGLPTLSACIINGESQRALAQVLAGQLIALNYGGGELYAMDQEALIGLAGQYVIATCGATAWES